MTSTHEAKQPIGRSVPGWEPRVVPPGKTLHGGRCTLVPLSLDHAPDLNQAFSAMAPQDWTYLPLSRPEDENETRSVLGSVLALPAALPYTVLVEGVAQGMLSLMRIDSDNGVIEIGWVVIGPTIRGTAVSTEAQRLLMGHVFDDLGYRRLEWKCDALNEPSNRAALRLGYTFEGIFRQAMVTKGRNRDTAWYSVLDREWPHRRTRLDKWLLPQNFDGSGRQHVRLSPIPIENDGH